MAYIVAHDFGTSSVKSCLFTTEGELLSTVTGKYDTIYSNATWVEQRPEEWWSAFCENNRTLLRAAPAGELQCVSFCGTYPNCIPVDREGRPLRNAIIWQDNRTGEEAAEIGRLLPQKYLEVYRGSKVTADRTACKLRWIRKHEPEIYGRIWKVIPSASNYIVLRLTGKAVTDLRIGFSTGLENLERTAWSEEVLEALDIPAEFLPELHLRTDVVGTVPEQVSEECGLPAGTPIVIGTGDGDSADIAVGMLHDGDAYLNGATSASICVVNTHIKGPWLMPTSCSGASISWMRHQLGRPEEAVARTADADPYDLINKAIESAPLGCHGVMFLPYLSGERATRNNPDARGSFTGITLETTREDLMRSVYEGIGMNLNLILQVARDAGYEIRRMPIVGGMAKSAVLRQIFADIMDVELFTFENMDIAGAAGCAVLGGMGTGLYADETECTRFMRHRDVTLPDPERHALYAERFPLFDRIYRALEPLYPEM